MIQFPCPACGQNIHASLAEPKVSPPAPPEPAKVLPTNRAASLRRREPVPQASSTRKGVVIHHSGTVMAAGGSNPEAYARYHVEEKGWPCIGYHFVIQPDGKVYQTLSMSDKGYHAGNVNATHFGVCFSGDFDHETLPVAAFEAGVQTVADTLQRYTTERQLIRHSDVASKTCPGTRFPWAEFEARVRALLR